MDPVVRYLPLGGDVRTDPNNVPRPDDAGAAAPGAAPASAPALTVSADTMQLDAGCAPPGEDATAAARRFWVEVIRRHTEAVSGSEGRVRVLDSAEPNRGRIVVEQAA